VAYESEEAMTITREMDRAMIADSSRWPIEGFLHLKKRTKDLKPGANNYEAFGVVEETSTPPIVVYLRPGLIETMSYDTIDALLDDGWIVD
jgi:hypothetical protein